MIFADTTFVIGVVIGGVVVAIAAFMRGYFQHFGNRAAVATISWWLPDSSTRCSDKELQKKTEELHNEITEFQTRKQRTSTREFWNSTDEDMSNDEIMRHMRQSSVRREETRGEFLKRFASRLEFILQEHEKRGIVPDNVTDLDTLRWLTKHGEAAGILPLLRKLSRKLDINE